MVRSNHLKDLEEKIIMISTQAWGEQDLEDTRQQVQMDLELLLTRLLSVKGWGMKITKLHGKGKPYKTNSMIRIVSVLDTSRLKEEIHIKGICIVTSTNLPRLLTTIIQTTICLKQDKAFSFSNERILLRDKLQGKTLLKNFKQAIRIIERLSNLHLETNLWMTHERHTNPNREKWLLKYKRNMQEWGKMMKCQTNTLKTQQETLQTWELQGNPLMNLQNEMKLDEEPNLKIEQLAHEILFLVETLEVEPLMQ